MLTKNYLPDDCVSMKLRVVNNYLFFRIWYHTCPVLTLITLSSIAIYIKYIKLCHK